MDRGLLWGPWARTLAPPAPPPSHQFDWCVAVACNRLFFKLYQNIEQVFVIRLPKCDKLLAVRFYNKTKKSVLYMAKKRCAIALVPPSNCSPYVNPPPLLLESIPFPPVLAKPVVCLSQASKSCICILSYESPLLLFCWLKWCLQHIKVLVWLSFRSVTLLQLSNTILSVICLLNVTSPIVKSSLITKVAASGKPHCPNAS